MATSTSIKPPFLDLLDSEPLKAAEQLYARVTGLMKTAPPRKMRAVPIEDRPDLIHDIVVHCIKDDFEVLRQYQAGRGCFEAWLFFVARNQVISWLRRRKVRPETVDLTTEEGVPIIEIMSGPENRSPARQAELRQTIEIVNSCIKKLGRKCQLLLRLKFAEFRPREIVRVLKLPKDQAKKVSGDITYCVKKLGKMLNDTGISPDTTDA